MWATSGFVFVILLSALRNVDTELVDASLLDGAGPMSRLRYVVLPQIMPVFLMVTTITLVGGFSVFIMTGGGPVMLPLVSSGAGALAVFTFLQNWNNILVPLLYLPGGEYRPLVAGTLITILPVMVLFVAMQRQVTQGFLSGAVKG